MPIRKAWKDAHGKWTDQMVAGAKDGLSGLDQEGADVKGKVGAVAHMLLPGAQDIQKTLTDYAPKDGYPDDLKDKHAAAKADVDKLVTWLNGQAGSIDAMDAAELQKLAGELESLEDNYPGLTALAEAHANPEVIDNLVAAGLLVRHGDNVEEEGAGGDVWVN